MAGRVKGADQSPVRGHRTKQSVWGLEMEAKEVLEALGPGAQED